MPLGTEVNRAKHDRHADGAQRTARAGQRPERVQAVTFPFRAKRVYMRLLLQTRDGLETRYFQWFQHPRANDMKDVFGIVQKTLATSLSGARSRLREHTSDDPCAVVARTKGRDGKCRMQVTRGRPVLRPD